MKKRLYLALLLSSAAIPTIAVAAEPPMHTVLTHLDGDLVSRNVELNELNGTPVIVTQVLRQLEDGSFEYDPALQSDATRAFDAGQCEPGASASTSVSTWGENTLHGSACLKEFDSVEEMIDWSQDRGGFDPSLSGEFRAGASAPGLTILESSAPGGYIIPAKVNSIHHGSTRYLLGANSILETVLVIDGTCQKLARDPVPGGRQGVIALAVNCYIPMYGQKSKVMRGCANQLCHTARSEFTVF